MRVGQFFVQSHEGGSWQEVGIGPQSFLDAATYAHAKYESGEHNYRVVNRKGQFLFDGSFPPDEITGGMMAGRMIRPAPRMMGTGGVYH